MKRSCSLYGYTAERVNSLEICFMSAVNNILYILKENTLSRPL